MDFRGWMPPEIVIGMVVIAVLGGSWIVVGIWWLSQHLTIGWH